MHLLSRGSVHRQARCDRRFRNQCGRVNIVFFHAALETHLCGSVLSSAGSERAVVVQGALHGVHDVRAECLTLIIS